MSVVVKQRSRMVAPVVLVLVGSLPAVAAVPSAAAGDGKPSNPAAYSACVAAATADAGFADMDGGHAKAAANCLAHYGITTGTAPGMYSPSASVTRAQMAVFLARAAGPAGLDLGAAADQGFGDISGYSMTFQDAINRVVKAGIMTGTSRSMFSPDAPVSRADMAVFLDGFVGKARIGPGGLGGASKYSDVKPDDDPFTDLGGVPFGTYGSIRKVYELGIAAGTGNRMFSPDASVSRNQMALFITRALAHTNARPAGLSLQANKTRTDTSTNGGFMLHAAHRSGTHMPMANTTLDLFSAASASAAFDQDGLCKTLAAGVTDPAASSSRCLIDTGDERTDPDGNVVVEVTGTDSYCAGTKRVWTWTGAAGARFDDDSTTSVYVDIGVAKHWRSVNVSSNLNEHATHVKFGQSITHTFQLVDGANGKGDAVAQKDVPVIVKVEETATPGGNAREVTRTHKTDASGKVELTFSYDDPNPAATGQEVRVVLTGQTGAMGAFLGKAPGQAVTRRLRTMIWSDAAAVGKTLTVFTSTGSLTVPNPTGAGTGYMRASDKGDGARNTVTAMVFDQYGDPVSGAPVHFGSNAVNNDGNHATNGLAGRNGGRVDFFTPEFPGFTDAFAVTQNTNSRGVARISYLRDSAASRAESINVVAQIGIRDAQANSERNDLYYDAAPGEPGPQGILFYWVTDATTQSRSNQEVKVVNKGANEFVTHQRGGAGNQHLAIVSKYDSNDHFSAQVGGAAAAVSMDDFVNSLALGNIMTVQMAADPVPGVNSFTNGSAGPARATPCHN